MRSTVELLRLFHSAISRHVIDKLAKELSRMGTARESLGEILYDTLSGRLVAVKMGSNLASFMAERERKHLSSRLYIVARLTM